MYITKGSKSQLSCRCHDNSYASGPSFITTKIPGFHLTQGSSTVCYEEDPCSTQKVATRDIWFFTERDWSQGCFHGNNIVGVILFLL